MKLSEAIILGRSLVEGRDRSGIWAICALGGATLAVLGKECHGYDFVYPFGDTTVACVTDAFPNITEGIASAVIQMFDCKMYTIEQISDKVREMGDCDSVNHCDTRCPSPQEETSHSPTATLSSVR